jgi:hypothetical protein
MANMISGVISITISAIVLANVFIYQIKNTNQSYLINNASGGSADVGSWSQSEKAMWTLLSLLAIVGLVYGVLAVFGIM